MSASQLGFNSDGNFLVASGGSWCATGAGTPATKRTNASQTAFTDNSAGTKSDTIAVGAGYVIYPVRLTLASLANAQEYQFNPGFAGKLISINARVIEAATTAAKAATVTGRVNAGAVGGGGVVALTSANCTPIGAQVAGTAVTGANSFTSAQTVGFTVGSVTAFLEGAIIVELTLQNTDLAAFIAAMADKYNEIRTVLNRHDIWTGS